MIFEDVEKLYIVKDGVTYTPLTTCERRVDKDGNVYGEHTIIKTAEEVANEIINSVPQKTEPEPKEILSKELAVMKIENMKKDVMMTNALKIIADLRVEVMSLKGGNA